jgi:hypothetical protein
VSNRAFEQGLATVVSGATLRFAWGSHAAADAQHAEMPPLDIDDPAVASASGAAHAVNGVSRRVVVSVAVEGGDSSWNAAAALHGLSPWQLQVLGVTAIGVSGLPQFAVLPEPPRARNASADATSGAARWWLAQRRFVVEGPLRAAEVVHDNDALTPTPAPAPTRAPPGAAAKWQLRPGASVGRLGETTRQALSDDETIAVSITLTVAAAGSVVVFVAAFILYRRWRRSRASRSHR